MKLKEPPTQTPTHPTHTYTFLHFRFHQPPLSPLNLPHYSPNFLCCHLRSKLTLLSSPSHPLCPLSSCPLISFSFGYCLLPPCLPTSIASDYFHLLASQNFLSHSFFISVYNLVQSNSKIYMSVIIKIFYPRYMLATEFSFTLLFHALDSCFLTFTILLSWLSPFDFFYMIFPSKTTPLQAEINELTFSNLSLPSTPHPLPLLSTSFPYCPHDITKLTTSLCVYPIPTPRYIYLSSLCAPLHCI